LATVAKLGDEQSLSLQIGRHVVDPPAHIAEQDPGFKLQGALTVD